MPLPSRPVPHSPSFADACDSFLDSVASWALDCTHRYGNLTPTDVHDQLTYTTGWEPVLTHRFAPEIEDFLREEGLKVEHHFVRSGTWEHGYWRKQEAHHGTEHFELYLGMMARLYPDNVDVRCQILDAVEHIGNEVSDIPPWYDRDTGLFRSLWLGSGHVGTDPQQFNTPDHLRLINMILIAQPFRDDHALWDLALDYTGRWADAILSEPEIPIGLGTDGVLATMPNESDAGYRSFMGMVGKLDTPLDRAENLFASGALSTLTAFWESSGQERFLSAAHHMIQAMLPALSDPDAGPLAHNLRLFRARTGVTDYDDAIVEVARSWKEPCSKTLSVDIDRQRAIRPPGIGKRTDMPDWYENGHPRRFNPITLSVAAEITADAELATRALDLAHTYFQLAVDTMQDGRNHGCAANTINAVARGHGRDAGCGMSTAVLAPTLQLQRQGFLE